MLQGQGFLDPLGPLRADWRSGDSISALVDDAHLAEVEATPRGHERSGRVAGWLAEHDSKRPAIRQISILAAAKDSSSMP